MITRGAGPWILDIRLRPIVVEVQRRDKLYLPEVGCYINPCEPSLARGVVKLVT